MAMSKEDPRNGLIVLQGATAWSNDRNRPYDGWSRRWSGSRGATPIVGATIRDICDCFIVAAMRQSGCDNLLERLETGSWLWSDLNNVDPATVDLTVIRNLMCNEIEKMMGIYPNVPPLRITP